MRDWGVDEWTALAEGVGAVGTVAAAIIALFTARQSKSAADSSANAARDARRSLALHSRPASGHLVFEGQAGDVPAVSLSLPDAPGLVYRSATVCWTASDGVAQERDLQLGGAPTPLPGSVVTQVETQDPDLVVGSFSVLPSVALVDFAGNRFRGSIRGMRAGATRIQLYAGADLEFELLD